MNCKLKVDYRKTYEYEEDLDPRDFIECDTINELKDKVANVLGIKNIEYSARLNENLEIPDEFIKEWKELVQFIPNNVMTYRLKDRLLKNNNIYTEIYSGEYLNNKKHDWSWNTFSYHLYRNFVFNNKKNYKCYLIDKDHWDHYSTTLIFAEEV